MSDISFRMSAIIGAEYVEREMPSSLDVLQMLRGGQIRGDVSIYPESDDFPRALLSLVGEPGFVVQCYESRESWSDFLCFGISMSAPTVPIELGGQALERWPKELFVPEFMAAEALDHFLTTGKQKSTLRWIRIDAFPRESIWESRAERAIWEAQQSEIRSADNMDSLRR